MTENDLMTAWLKESKSLSFFLPDGPYGRPFDDVYHFQSIVQDGLSLNINFSDGISFRFAGHPVCERVDRKLIIKGFTECEFVEGGKVVSTYTDGEVTLIRF